MKPPMLPGTRPLLQLVEAGRHRTANARHEAILAAAPALRNAIEASGLPTRIETFDTASFPYPTRFAFNGACRLPLPYVWLQNRALYVEYQDLGGHARRILVNPSDATGAKAAPYFKQLLETPPAFMRGPFERVLSKKGEDVPTQLRAIGVDPASIDFITFDHLHVQDVRRMLGPSGFYPSARLLVTEPELAAARSPHPLQRHWYVPGSVEGIADARVVAFNADLLLGHGIALIRTPGHTEGNHTIVVMTPEGPITISENGIAAECYAPDRSEIPGLRNHAMKTGEAFILNANTREGTLAQYTSMALERELSTRRGTDGFPYHFSSSELTDNALAPGVRPTFSIGRVVMRN